MSVTLATINKYEKASSLPAALTDGDTKAWYIWNEDYTLDGTGVTALNDQSGNGYHLAPTAADGSAPAAANYPTWHSTDGITFDGNDDVLKATMTGWTTYGTIYIVCRQVGWTDNDVLIAYAGTGGTRVAQDNTGEGASPNIHAIHASGSSLAITGLTIGTWGILTINTNQASPYHNVKLNNGSYLTNTTSMTGFTSAGIILGATHAAAPALQRWGNVGIKEVIVRSVNDDSADETAIYNYLYNKYFA